MSYALSHLPGAVNLPGTWVSERAAWRIPDFETEVVVYCESFDCDKAEEVGSRLVELGYRNVRHYAGGKRDWIDAGLPIEGAAR
jgi:rhodanese-related sulfurtransferase